MAQAAVREAVNATGAPLCEGLLHGGFFARAAAAPDAVAVAWGDEDRLTYAELRDRALRIGALLERRGVRPGDAVGVTLPRERPGTSPSRPRTSPAPAIRSRSR